MTMSGNALGLDIQFPQDGSTCADLGANVFLGSQTTVPYTLISIANHVSTDASLSNIFNLVITEDTTLDNPTNLEAGTVYYWIITQDSTPRTLLFDTVFTWNQGIPLVISAGNNAVDIIEGIYDGTSLRMNIVGQNYSVLPQFVFTVNTANAGSANNKFIFPTTSSGTYNCTVQWGDGSSSKITTYNDPEWTHTYSAPGIYNISITGTISGIFMNGDNLKWIKISNWGPFNPGNVGNWFLDASNLTITAQDVLDLTGVTVLTAALKGCSSITTIPNIDSWDVSGVTLFTSMFENCSLFNSSIDSWDISSATGFGNMFKNASSYNQSMNSWVLPSSLLSMASMFEGASAFNGNITSWTFLGNISLNSMFYNASAFNQAIGSWGGINYITNVVNLFFGAISFNQSLSSWNLSSISNSSGMFNGASSFDSALPTFGISLTNTSNMFYGATAFNQSISTINTTNVTNFSGMFQAASSFNHSSITSLKTSNGTNFSSMFNSASAFNQNIQQNSGNWVTSSGQNFSLMFYLATSFNQPITNWQTGNAANMSSMFYGATAFNQDISGWDVSNVTNMDDMLRNLPSFNQNLGAWTPFSLQSANRMLLSSTLSTANYNALLVALDNAVSYSNVLFGGGNSTYDSTSGGNDGAYARNDLITNWSWTITDGGHA